MLLGMAYMIYMPFQLEDVDVIGPLYYIYIIVYGTKHSLNTYKLSRVHHISQRSKQFYLEIEIIIGHFFRSICFLYLT